MPSAPVFVATASGSALLSAAQRPGTALPGGAVATVTGAPGQNGTFAKGDAVFGLDRGFILSTGTATPPGSNGEASFGRELGGEGHNGLQSILYGFYGAPVSTSDAATLKLTFTNNNPAIKTISFDVVFASEDYPEFSGTPYSDLAAIYVNGANVALVNGEADQPLGVLPESVSEGLFLDNRELGLPVEYDGVGMRLTVSAPVRVGANALTFAIADSGDMGYDSALLVGNIALGTGTATGLTVPVNARDDLAYLGAGGAVGGNLFADNGLGADRSPAGGALSIVGVDGAGGKVGQTVVLPSGANLRVNANGTFLYDAGPMVAKIPAATGYLEDTFTYIVRESRTGTTDTATVTMIVYAPGASAPVKLTNDGLGNQAIGLATFAAAMDAAATLPGTATGTLIDVAGSVTQGGSATLALDGMVVNTGPAFCASLFFTPAVATFTANGGGTYSILANDQDNVITGGEGAETVIALGGNDRIDGAGGNDIFFGGDGNDVLLGGAGNDGLTGNAGVDDLRGGGGNDRLFIDRADLYSGGDGNDTAYLVETGSYDVDGSSIEQWIGSPGNDEIDGSASAAAFYPFGLGGNDTLRGSSGNDKLVGGEGDDLLEGNAGKDNINGSAGADTLVGGPQNDIIVGGGGSDFFVATPGGGGDQILDWADGTDRLDFRQHGGVASFADLTVTKDGATAFVFYGAGQGDYFVLYGAFAGGHAITDADCIF